MTERRCQIERREKRARVPVRMPEVKEKNMRQGGHRDLCWNEDLRKHLTSVPDLLLSGRARQRVSSPSPFLTLHQSM